MILLYHCRVRSLGKLLFVYHSIYICLCVFMCVYVCPVFLFIRPRGHLIVKAFFTNVTLHHKMGLSVRFGDFELGIASYRTFSALFNGENRFKIN